MVSDAEVEAMKDLAKDIWAKAQTHNGRYLLPWRFRHGADPEKDKLYDACEWLVQERIARWISSSSTMYPGIELLAGAHR